ncbi:unnamed protein product [Trichobilharzia regenti]|nr:unnamed protein product [Trichobilharzia regenti]
MLSDVEAQITSEDVSCDLSGVMNAQRRHNLLESDVAAHRERIDVFKVQADTLAVEGHFDAPIIQENQRQVTELKSLNSALSNPETSLKASWEVAPAIYSLSSRRLRIGFGTNEITTYYSADRTRRNPELIHRYVERTKNEPCNTRPIKNANNKTKVYSCRPRLVNR